MEKRFSKIGLLVGAIIGLSATLFSCNDSDSYDAYAQLDKELKTIDEYLANNNIAAEKDPLGIRMVVTQLGTGLPANILDTINVDYTGKLFSNNTTFDAGNTQGALAGYIDGWKVAFLTLPAGSRATLYIPSPLAYGNQNAGSIPANSTLVFDVTFNRVVATTAKTKRWAADTAAIRKYIKDKNITGVTEDATGVSYKIESGSGATPSWYNRVKLTYTITVMSNGTKPVENLNREPSDAFYSRVVDYIHGIKVGLMKMPVGSKATLYVPSGLAFGTQVTRDASGNALIPANSNIIVDIELKEIVK